MPPYGPISWRRLVRILRKAGFDGPFPGGRHVYMLRGNTRITIPNPHGQDIGIPLLRIILFEGGISRDEWEAL